MLLEADLWSALGTTEAELNKQLSKTKVKLYFEAGSAFLGTIMSRLKFKWDWSIETAQVDGVTLSWNPAFYLWLDAKNRVTVLAHELWHVGFQHMLRLMGRDFELWNQACDYVINALLRKHGYDFSQLGWTLYDPKFTGMSTEEVYELLKKEKEKQKKKKGGQQPLPFGSGQGGGTPVPMGPNGLPQFGAPGSTPNMSRDVIQAPKDSVQEVITTIVQATQNARRSKHWGDVPGEVSLVLDTFLNPIIPWQTVLRRFFIDRAKDDLSYARPSRRNMDETFVMPSVVADNGLTRLNYYLDVSGSVTDKDVIRFNSELFHIKKVYNPETLTLVTFDTRIQNELVIPQDSPFGKITITGRGGTSLECVARHIEKSKPTAAIIFTDMYVNPMRRLKQKIPIIWICVGNKGATVPFGQLIHIPNEN